MEMTLRTLGTVLIGLTFTIACLGLWGLLDAVATLSPHWNRPIPAFTRLLVDCRGCLLVLPLPLILVGVLARKRLQTDPGAGSVFLSGTLAVLCLIFFPVFLGLLLPCFQILEG